MGLFSSRPRRRPRTSGADTPAPGPTPERVDEIDREAADLTARLDTVDAPQRPDLLDRLGALAREKGDADEAIALFTRSLAERETYGPAYHALLDLYNEKRAEAAAAGDRAGIDTWAARLDDHLALSKRILRSRY